MSKRMVILGVGESGAGTAVLTKTKGSDAFVSDKPSIKPKYKEMLDNHGVCWEEGQHTEAGTLNADEVVKSLGIPDKAPIVQLLKKQGTPIISEIEFAGRYTDSKMTRITGSNGKTTTTMLTYHILKEVGVDMGLARDVGNSLALQAMEDPHAVYVIELSSFQLDNMYDFGTDIATILNITPDYLDRYNYEIQNYVDAKFRILQNQTKGDAFIFWDDSPIIAREIVKRHPEATLYPFAETCENGVKGCTENNQVIIETANGTFTMEQDPLALIGTHNLYNSLASGIASKIVDIHDEKIRASLSDFTGVEHCLEKALCIRGVDYINGSKAANVNSCWYALQSMTTPVVLILGGTDKGNDYSEIEELVNKKVYSLIFTGVDSTRLHAFFNGKVANIEDARLMEEAVAKAYKIAHKGDTVLLPPCCAGFDLFKGYEDQGDQFRACIRNL